MKRLAIAMGCGVVMALVAVSTHPSPAPTQELRPPHSPKALSQ